MPSTQTNSAFAAVEAAPPDAILGLTDAFSADPRPGKINLGVGVYKDEAGQTPVLGSVKAAERAMLEAEATKSYKPIAGDPAYRRAVRALLFGDAHELATGGRARTAHTPGGTGGLRVAGDFIHQNLPDATLWHSDPTWANHADIFAAAGVPTRAYAYYDPATFGLDFDAMTASLDKARPGDIVLLHGCCHNPTGADLSPEQWSAVAQLLAQRGLIPLVDFAYQGFADGIEEDAAGLRTLAQRCPDMLVCSSFSKNFGLYMERTGALTIVAGTQRAAASAFSKIEQAIRRNYSNPPAHGGAIVATILGEDGLRAKWEGELAQMRGRINQMRTAFADALDARGVSLAPDGNGFVARQRGMFSFTGLTKDQVATLKDQHAIYIVGSGRINVAGITADNLDRLCDAIAQVRGA